MTLPPSHEPAKLMASKGFAPALSSLAQPRPAQLGSRATIRANASNARMIRNPSNMWNSSCRLFQRVPFDRRRSSSEVAPSSNVRNVVRTRSKSS